ncbi:MAG: class I SAM-dependent methyltransferase [Hyphomonadaceae bacterium]
MADAPEAAKNHAVETYEAAQNFSRLNAWLHGFRFRQLVKTARALAPDSAQIRPLRVLEFGCAHGKAFAALDAALPISYLGVDQHAAFLAEAERLHGARPNFRALCASADAFAAEHAPTEAAQHGPFDFIFALETLEHMPRDRVARLLDAIAALRPRLFVASVPVEIGPAILLKNVGSALTGYARHREYDWRETLWAACYRLDKLPPHACGHKGFDWRCLKAQIAQRFEIVRMRRFPLGPFPPGLSTSLYFEARPK